MAHDVSFSDLPLKRLEAFPSKARVWVIGLIALGALAMVAALFTDADRAWRAYLFNWLFFMGIAQGGVILVAATVITKAVWARPVRRIALSLAAFLPIAFVLYLPLMFVGDSLFPWTEHMYHEGMEVWLNEPFVAIRNLVLLAAMMGTSLYFVYLALRPDLGLYREEVPERLRGLYGRFTGGWRGQEAEELWVWRRLSTLAVVVCLLYAVAMSMVAWDYVMALEAGWFSTLIGPYYFMAAFLGAIATTGILSVVYRGVLGLEGIIEPPHFHDLGKLTFAFCIFWAYMLWSQFIVIWYGMLPWEQTFLVHRISAPYTPLAITVFLLLFVTPFFALLGVRAKTNNAFYVPVAGLILLGLWLERYTLVYPSLYPGADSIPFGWPEIGIGLVFAGLFVGAVVWFATTFPILQSWQPAADPALFDDTRDSKDYLAAHGKPEEAEE